MPNDATPLVQPPLFIYSERRWRRSDSPYELLEFVLAPGETAPPDFQPFRMMHALCDASTGQELARGMHPLNGKTPSECFDLWEKERPKAEADLHEGFRKAQAQASIQKSMAQNGLVLPNGMQLRRN